MGLSQETAERGGIRFDALFYTVVVFKNPMADSAPEGDGSLFAALPLCGLPCYLMLSLRC